jgi:tetratricopeptide (TPR) repeat protein
MSLSGFQSKVGTDELYDSYLESLFSYKFDHTRKVLYTLKKNHYDDVRTKLALAGFYLLMYETGGEENKFYILCKKEADAVIDQLSRKKNPDKLDVFHLISAKSMLLKIQFKKKQYLKAAGEMKRIIDYFEYALKHETDKHMRLIAGMYNFYIETAKEDYPVTYPILIFWPEGNKAKGIHQLKASVETDQNNISVRSLLYLGRIYHRDLKNYTQCKYYYDKLLSQYPDNLYWRYEYIQALEYFKKENERSLQKKILKEKAEKNDHLSPEQKRFFMNVSNT